jgi:putative transposase
MPWRETCAMDERVRMVGELLAGEEPHAAVFVRYAVSAKTGYKWLGRYRAQGAAGLIERSHAPHRHGRVVAAGLVEQIVALRERWPHWGPRKLRVKLGELVLAAGLPAASTIGEVLRREGLVRPARRRRRCPVYSQPFLAAEGPNDVWCLDFKSLPRTRSGGWFRTGDGSRCDPLTLSDAHSRYVLAAGR